tara:strand:- start:20275 stop:21171 length:897 start_codon:yes stop_codon:yes gene_type:complete
MKILVTGSNGCVGSALKKACINDNNWIFIERSDCDLTNRDETLSVFKNVNPDYVIHLASYVPGFYNINKVASFSNNVRINENVLEACNTIGIERAMMCLSVNMFTENPSKFPMDESMIFEGPLSGDFAGYAFSKRMLELQCQNYNQQYNRKYFGIIPCNIYGPNDNFSSGRLIPNLILKFKDAIKNNSDVILNGTGNPLRQFIYSNDLAIIIKYLVINYNDIKPIICSANSEISISELANYIALSLDFKNKIKFDISKKDGNLKKTVSNEYLKQIMPNIKFTDLMSGLKETINSMENL